MSDGSLNIGAIKRLSKIPDEDGAGSLIGGQEYDNVYFTGGTISGVDGGFNSIIVSGDVGVGGNVGVGGAALSSVCLNASSATLSGIGQYGVRAAPVFTSSATTAGIGVVSSPSTAATAFTMTTMYSMFAGNAVAGAGSTITTNIGLFVQNQTAGTTNWSVFSEGLAPSYSAGEYRFGTTDSISPESTTTNGVLIGRFTGSIYGSANAGASFRLQRTGNDGAVARFFRDTADVGNIAVTAFGTSYNTLSDERVKDGFIDVVDATKTLMKLKPYSAYFKNDETKTRYILFKAHEVQEVMPEAVTGEKDAIDETGKPIMQGIDHSWLIPMLVAALQEANHAIDNLSARLDILESPLQ